MPPSYPPGLEVAEQGALGTMGEKTLSPSALAKRSTDRQGISGHCATMDIASSEGRSRAVTPYPGAVSLSHYGGLLYRQNR